MQSGGKVVEQIEMFPVPSPCRGICQADERGYCRGCLRSREERFGWTSYSDAQKRNVLRLCHQRRLRQRNKPTTPDAQPSGQPDLF